MVVDDGEEARAKGTEDVDAARAASLDKAEERVLRC